MKILHRYLLRQLLRNLLLTVLVFCFLFLMVDFFDRIDNIMGEDTTLLTVLSYFFFKIPVWISETLPVAVLIASLFTVGVLARNSEITAMRASGLTIFWIARPLLLGSLALSVLAVAFNETVLPYCARRSKEIYNIDIRKKDQTGDFSQSDLWWRNKNRFFSVGIFDSRSSTFHNVSTLDLNDSWEVEKRADAELATWVDPLLGWTMRNVTEYRFESAGQIKSDKFKSLPLPIKEEPTGFYDIKSDPQSMGFFRLRKYIKQLRSNGIAVSEALSDLNAKIAFPFVIFISCLVVLPFALKPARSGNMATSFLAGIFIGFTYYAVHSLSMALGRAEILPAFMAAWTANILMLLVGVVLNLGAESPN